MSERHNRGKNEQRFFVENRLREAAENDLLLHRESDRQLFNNTDPKTPVVLLRKRGETLVEIAAEIKRKSRNDSPAGLIEELSSLVDQVRESLEREDDKRLNTLLSPRIKLTTSNGVAIEQTGNRMQLLVDTYFPPRE